MMMKVLILGLVLAVSVDAWNHDQNGRDWDSEGDCALDRQSPINILSTTANDASLTPIVFNPAYLGTPVIGEWINTKHGVQVNVKDNVMRTIKGGPLGTTEYNLLQFHFHWGSNPTQGSEHTLDGKAFPAEVHFVHKKVDDAAAGDGYSVMGFWIDFNDPNPPQTVRKWATMIKRVRNYNSMITKPTKVILSQILSDNKINRDRYFTYAGSLTTPNCNRVVTWINMKDNIKLPLEVLVSMRKVRDDRTKLIIDNYRVTIPTTETVRSSSG